MFIKTVVLDGFKSYAQRTEISGFDHNFNAITGLNGSGKSNILDSICFLLGISNLSQVRASNLQELIYKSGQAGVTKATVTITFDNADKKQSPIGYESFEEITISRQIVLGGRNKYLINGCNANNTRVQDLFRSVQLNINNPHFLIMQGRITKVLNMKPPEILSMIEEAAGTRMYESKKQSAQRTMEKKESKLKEIETILNEEITPTISKLKEERTNYLEYQKVIREIEHLTRLCVAYEFVKAEEVRKSSGIELENMQEGVLKRKERSDEIEKSVKTIDAEIQEIQEKKDLESGGILQQLEKKLDDRSKADMKANSDLKHAKEALGGEKKKRKQLQKNLDDNASQIKTKEKEIGKRETATEKLERQSKTDAEAVTAAQEHFHAVSAGLSSNEDGEDKTLADQLMDCKNAISQADTEMKQANMKLKHNSGELKKKQADLKSTEKGYEKDGSVFEKLEKEKEKLQAEISKLNYDEGRNAELSNLKQKLEEDVNKLRTIVETLEARFPHLQFEYKNPEPNFDRSKVKGLICNLMTVKDLKTATALEVAAGGKLYNVVVDNEVTSQKLLEKGQLKRRVTIIPLNKIAAKSINSNAVKKAKELVGQNNVNTAISLVGYDDQLQAAMQFVFGSSFVCSDMNTAKKVTFDKDVRTRSVTLEGEVFDPAGTLSGGARAQKASILEKLQEFNESTGSLREKEKQLQEVKKEVHQLMKTVEKYDQLKKQFELKSTEAQLIQERLKQSTHHHKVEEVKELEKSIDEQKKLISKSEEIKKNSVKKAEDLEFKMKEAKQHREKELKKAEDALTKAKTRAENSIKEFKAKQQEIQEEQLEIVELQNEIKSLQDQLKALDDNMAQMEEKINTLVDAAKETKQAVTNAEEELEKQKAILRGCNEAINEKSKERNKLAKEAQDVQLELKELEHKITKFNKDSQDAARKVEQMLQRYDWIATERQYFGQPNTTYDFTANDPKEASRRLSKLQETKEKLSKNVNMRAMNMLGKAEEKYNDLIKKKRIVENDRAKIEEVIRELDEKKNEALRKAHHQVNKDFGSIFSTLLPGTNAKLAPCEGMSVLDGLEVKVAFGNVWKESLTELSGGQRSLVALSLILALLLFSPAPIYILDEVDAALDLSHTQNIGHMLRTHFKRSQFIVVSLKDGMFNNANVLFKTKFVDGVSTVTRYVQNQPSSKEASKGGHSK